MNIEVKSATQATEIAISFVSKHFLIARPMGATREGGNWIVKIDVGPLAKQIATVTIDSKTGEITEYNIP